MSGRYSRQTALPEVGEEGQKRLAAATVVIVGLGGLGTTAAELLCRAGVGRLVLVEHDVVELSNLQRQSLYDEKDIGTLKTEAAANRLKRINSDVKIITHTEKIDRATTQQLGGADVILDCTDNLETRRLLNAYAVGRKVPFIFCSAQGMRGMLYVVDSRQGGRACFACVFGRLTAFAQPAQTGVLGSAVRVAASLQAAEALKLLLGKPCTVGLVSFDVWEPRLDVFAVKRDPACKVCGKKST
jgi:molybdopterin/thiamine biosynthesis adenylyltransferase